MTDIESQMRQKPRAARPNTWPAERIEALKALRKEGMTSGEIAKRLGVTRNSICGMSARLDLPDRVKAGPRKLVLPPRSLTGADIDAMIKSGMTPRTIAHAHGLSYDKVCRIAREGGVNLTLRQSTNSAQIAALRRMKMQQAGMVVSADTTSWATRFADGYQGQRGNIAMENLEPRHCRYPITTSAGVRFCGDERNGTSVYCAAHADRCFNHRVGQ